MYKWVRVIWVHNWICCYKYFCSSHHSLQLCSSMLMEGLMASHRSRLRSLKICWLWMMIDYWLTNCLKFLSLIHCSRYKSWDAELQALKPESINQWVMLHMLRPSFIYSFWFHRVSQVHSLWVFFPHLYMFSSTLLVYFLCLFVLPSAPCTLFPVIPGFASSFSISYPILHLLSFSHFCSLALLLLFTFSTDLLHCLYPRSIIQCQCTLKELPLLCIVMFQ